MSQGLPVSLLINVSVNQAPAAAQYANLNSCLIMGDSTVIDTKQRIRSYAGISGVASDFGTSAPEYLAAVEFFSQTPAPTQLYIGRWAKAATSGINLGGILTPAQQLASAWTSITTGGIDFTIDGTAVNLTGLNFSGVSNMNGVAAVINTGLSTHGSCVWLASTSQLLVTSSTTGASSTVAAATTGGGTDISAQTKLTAATQSYSVPGIVAESAVAAVAIMDNLSTNWYFLNFATANNNTDIADSDNLAIAAYIEADANNLHEYGITSQETSALSTTDTTSIGYQLKQLAYKRTFYQYSSSSPYAVASLIGRFVTVNFNGNATTITGMYKTEPGVTPESLTVSQYNALVANNWNFYTTFNNNTMIIVGGIGASGIFIDSIYNADWLANYIQTNVYNLLYSSPTKIPQTDAGNNLIANQIEASCAQGVANGYLAPGQWNSAGFGQLTQGALLSKGYYIYFPPIASQSQSNRNARISVPFQIAVKEAGAVHTVAITVNVNR